jgi:hypothetical protein
MKKLTTRKSILGILLCLTILAAMLVPAMPVAADSTFITIIAGGTSYPVLASTFAGLPHVTNLVCSYTKDDNDNLTADAAIGATTIVVNSLAGLEASETVTISDTASSETTIISSIDSPTKTLTLPAGLVHAYTVANKAKIYSPTTYKTYSGVPVYQLIANVYSGLTTTNDIKVTGSGSFYTLVGPTSSTTYGEQTAIVANNNLIVADANETGSQTTGTIASPTFNAGAAFAGSLVSLEVVNPIIVTSGSNGSVAPNSFAGTKTTYNGIVPVSYGGTQAFTISPTNPSTYHVATLTVDGVAQTPATSYTFSNVTANHTLAATFSNSAVSVYIDPASQVVANGTTFTANLAINTNTATRGWQATVNFDAAKLTLNSVTEGTFLSNYASSYSPPGGTIPGGSVSINNSTGVATIPGWAISNAGTSGPTGTGTLAVLNFTAKASVNNYAAITPANVVVTDVVGAAITGLTTTAGQAAIGTLPLPDLTVSNVVVSPVSGTPTNYSISFQVNNLIASGNAGLDAGASSASIVVDGGTPVVIAVPAIAKGTFAAVTTASPITLSGTSDSFVITADSTNAILEVNENNNTASGIYSHVAATGATTDVDGKIGESLTFTQPGVVNFGLLHLGSNQIINPMTVLSTQSWIINVHGNAPTSAGGIDGKMTKMDASGNYNAYIKLHNALHVVAGAGYMGAPADPSITAPADYDVGLTGVDQLLAVGIPDGQNTDGASGETRNAIFNQTVIGSDAALSTGYSYHIVVSFTVSGTDW